MTGMRGIELLLKRLLSIAMLYISVTSSALRAKHS